MGGSGSTRWRWYTPKSTVERCIRLSVTDLMRKIPPSIIEKRSEWSGRMKWLRGDVTTYSIDFTADWSDDNPLLLLSYAPSYENGQFRWKTQPVELQTTPCRYGGVRYWFSCPRCDRRCGCLYIAPRDSRWACRKCHDLTYKSAQTAHEGESSGYLGLVSHHINQIARIEKLEKQLQNVRFGSKKHIRLVCKIHDLWLAIRSHDTALNHAFENYRQKLFEHNKHIEP